MMLICRDTFVCCLVFWLFVASVFFSSVASFKSVWQQVPVCSSTKTGTDVVLMQG